MLLIQKINNEGYDSLTVEELTTLNEIYKKFDIPIPMKHLDNFSDPDSINRIDTFTRPGPMSDGGIKINEFSSLDLKPRIDTYSRPASLGDGGMPSRGGSSSSGGEGICICIGIVIIIVIVVLLLKFFFHVF